MNTYFDNFNTDAHYRCTCQPGTCSVGGRQAERCMTPCEWQKHNRVVNLRHNYFMANGDCSYTDACVDNPDVNAWSCQQGTGASADNCGSGGSPWLCFPAASYSSASA